MIITDIHLESKIRTAAVITISDKASRGERIDTSGSALVKILSNCGWEVTYTKIIPDDFSAIRAELLKCADDLHITLIFTTGGTGFSPRDVTPEATLSVIEREARGIPEAMRAESMKITPMGCLSRAVAGIRVAHMLAGKAEDCGKVPTEAAIRHHGRCSRVQMAQAGQPSPR